MNRKRSKGRLPKSITLKDIYKFYKEEQKKRNRIVLSKIEFVKTCKDYCFIAKEKAVEEGEEIVFPTMGKLKIVKTENDFTKIPQNKWPIDWKKTKELGYKVYFTDDYKYHILWDKSTCLVKNKTLFKFISCRGIQRQLKEAIKVRKKDYFTSTPR